MSTAYARNMSNELESPESVEYDRIARSILYASVAESAKGVVLSDEFGTVTSSPTATIQTEPLREMYAVIDTRFPPNNITLTSTTTPITSYSPGSIWMLPDAVHTIAKSRFDSLARQWKNDTQHLSCTDVVVAHPAYRQIIKMGRQAVPLILKDLKENGGYWFTALSEITHFTPPLPHKKTSLRDLASAWIAWGKTNAKATQPSPRGDISSLVTYWIWNKEQTNSERQMQA